MDDSYMDPEEPQKRGFPMKWIAIIALVPLLFFVVKTPDYFSKPAREYRAILKEFGAKEKAFYGRYRDAKTNEEKQAIAKAHSGPAQYVGRMYALAQAFPRSKWGFEALKWSVGRAGYLPETEKAIKLLADKYTTDSGIDISLIGSLEHVKSDTAAQLLDGIIKDHSSAQICGYAMVVKGKRRLNAKDESGEDILEQAAEKYGDIMLRTKTVGQVARGELHERRNLGIGKMSPEIEGEDIDGVKFKLSDYRGKVVVIDFWGDW